MSEPRLDLTPPDPASHLPPLLRLWNGLTDGLAALGTILVGLLMLVISADVVARNGFGGSLPLISELGALMVVMIVYLQLGSAVRHRRLARADMFFDWLSVRHPRRAAALGAVFDVLGALLIAVLAYSTAKIVGSDFRFGESIGVTGVLTLPVWPFRVLILTGLAVATIQFLVLAVQGIGEAKRRAGGARR